MVINEMLVALCGVPFMFAVAFVWCWLEGRGDRKRDEQRATYDKWMRERMKER